MTGAKEENTYREAMRLEEGIWGITSKWKRRKYPVTERTNKSHKRSHECRVPKDKEPQHLRKTMSYRRGEPRKDNLVGQLDADKRCSVEQF